MPWSLVNLPALAAALALAYAPLAARAQAPDIAHFPFDGNAVDITAFSNNAVVQGPELAPDRGNGANGAYRFDGINDSIVVANASQYALATYSLTFWVRPSSTGTPGNGTVPLVRKGVNPTFAVLWAPASGALSFLASTNSGGPSTLQTLTASTGIGFQAWYHVAVTFGSANGGTMRVFIDGTQRGLLTGVGNPTANGDPISIGGGVFSAVPAWFAGDVDDVRLYGRELSPAEVTALAGSGGPPNDAFLAATAIDPAGITLQANNRNATREILEPDHAGLRALRSVWWSWTPVSSGTATIETTGSNFDTVLAVYTGFTLSTLFPVAANDNAIDVTSRATLEVIAGETYWIAVDGKSGATGDISLTVALDVPPPPASAQLSVSAVPAEGGSVSGAGTFGVGSTRVIAALPASGFRFVAWADGSTSNPRYVIVPQGGGAYSARFDAAVGNGHPFAPTISNAPSTNLRVGDAFSFQFSATGNTPSWDLVAGSLPAGLTLSPSGAIAGTPLSAGPVSTTIRAANAAGEARIEIPFTVATGPTATGSARVANLATRGFVGTGDQVLIGGLVVDGEGLRRVLIRGLGPALLQRGIPAALSNPYLTLYRNTAIVATNDNWNQAPNLAELQLATSAVGAPPFDQGSGDAALLVTLPPGVYTVILSGIGGATGVGLIEIFDAP